MPGPNHNGVQYNRLHHRPPECAGGTDGDDSRTMAVVVGAVGAIGTIVLLGVGTEGLVVFLAVP